jgi:hypothetical protein
MKKWRKIRLGVLLSQGVVYRVFIVCSNTAFFWIITGEFKMAASYSLGWNLVNMGLYYLFHFVWAKRIKIGR